MSLPYCYLIQDIKDESNLEYKIFRLVNDEGSFKSVFDNEDFEKQFVDHIII